MKDIQGWEYVFKSHKMAFFNTVFFLEMKSECPSDPEPIRIREIQVISPEIEVKPENFKYVPYPKGIFPIRFIIRGN